MFHLFHSADAYLKESDWKDLALVKACLFAMGVMVGMCTSVEKRQQRYKWARRVFAVTYVPLMAKYVRVVKSMHR